MSREQFPGSRSAATSPKVLRSLIPLPGLWGSGGGGAPEQSVSQQARGVPAASTTGNLAQWPGGQTAGLESITFDFNQEVELLVLAAQIMRHFSV